MSKRGFTLIELMVVIAIIGLLATIITASLGSARAKSRDARRVADIRIIQTALQLYRNDNGMFPKNIYCPSSGGASPCGSTPPLNGLWPTYIAAVPKDPSAAGTANCAVNGLNTSSDCYHYYALSANGVCNANNAPVLYHLGAALENIGDASLSQDSDADDLLSTYGTFQRCSTAAPSSFSGYADKCAVGGTTLANGTENCYDVTP